MSRVYFTKNITPEGVPLLFEKLGKPLCGRVAVKVHSGEKGNQNFLKPEFWKPIIDTVGGTVVETNTAYDGERNVTDKHLKLLGEHGWSEYFPTQLLDDKAPDLALPVPNGKILKENLVGRHTSEYDSMLVLAHFKGHPMGGYGGALKQLAIGCASSAGKSRIHSGGVTDEQSLVWKHTAPQNDFLEAMADAAKSVIDLFEGRIVYINVMKNLSVDCDCCAVAEDPCMGDVGMLISDDPVAIDKACIDLVYASNDPGKEHFIERVETRNGTHLIDAAKALGCGSDEYDLITLD